MRVLPWYKDAAEKLKDSFIEEDVNKIEGYEFVADYLKNNQPDMYADIDFSSEEDFEDLVRSSIEPFEEWLRSGTSEWLYIGKGFRWIAKEVYDDSLKKEISIKSPAFTDEEKAILEKDIQSFSHDDYEMLNSVYQRSLSSTNKEFTAKCAHRIAQYFDYKKGLPYDEFAELWSSAGDLAIEAGIPGAYKFFRIAAEIYAREMAHHDSAKLYKKALDQGIVEKHSVEILLETTRVCRKQFELSGEVSDAAEIFIIENDIKLSHASKQKWTRNYFFKWLFQIFLKKLFNYGESPKYVALWSLFLIVSCALFYCVFGVSGKNGIENSFGISLYYSVVTFTTLGYGDFSPAGPLVRAISAIEAVFGLFLTSTFLVTFVRKYSR